MNDLLEKIVNAIIRQEGMAPVYPNPGNLRAAPWRVNPHISKGFWQPAARVEGIAGAAHIVMLRIAEGQTLRQLISAWAPPSDGNQTAIYIRNVQQWSGVPDADQPLWNYLVPISPIPASPSTTTTTT